MAKQRITGYYVVKRKHLKDPEIAFYNEGIFLLTGIERHFFERDFEWAKYEPVKID